MELSPLSKLKWISATKPVGMLLKILIKYYKSKSLLYGGNHNAMDHKIFASAGKPPQLEVMNPGQGRKRFQRWSWGVKALLRWGMPREMHRKCYVSYVARSFYTSPWPRERPATPNWFKTPQWSRARTHIGKKNYLLPRSRLGAVSPRVSQTCWPRTKIDGKKSSLCLIALEY